MRLERRFSVHVNNSGSSWCCPSSIPADGCLSSASCLSASSSFWPHRVSGFIIYRLLLHIPARIPLLLPLFSGIFWDFSPFFAIFQGHQEGHLPPCPFFGIFRDFVGIFWDLSDNFADWGWATDGISTNHPPPPPFSGIFRDFLGFLRIFSGFFRIFQDFSGFFGIYWPILQIEDGQPMEFPPIVLLLLHFRDFSWSFRIFSDFSGFFGIYWTILQIEEGRAVEFLSVNQDSEKQRAVHAINLHTGNAVNANDDALHDIAVNNNSSIQMIYL